MSVQTVGTLAQASLAQRHPSSPDLQSQQPATNLNRELIAGRVAGLLAHYWTDQMPEQLQAMIASDWLEDLVEFPAPIVAEACQAWRRTERRKPMPCDIRARCLEIQREAAERDRPRVQYLPAPQASRASVQAQRFKEAEEAREAWARAHGCPSFKEALRIGLQHVAKMTLKEPEPEPARELAQWDRNPQGGDALAAPSRSDESPVREADAP